MEALARLHSTVVAAYRVNPNITFEVFIHKVDGLSEDYKIGMLILRESMVAKVDMITCSRVLIFYGMLPVFCFSLDTQRDIQQTTTDELADAGLENVQLAFYLTSIYDHSIFEAFSKVIQKLIPQLPTLENLLNILCAVCPGFCFFALQETHRHIKAANDHNYDSRWKSFINIHCTFHLIPA